MCVMCSLQLFACLYAEPLPPTHIYANRTRQQPQNIIVSIEWRRPVGVGPEYFIQSFVIYIESETGLFSRSDTVTSTSWDVTLNYDTNYTVSVISVNCAGISDMIILEDIRFGKWFFFFTLIAYINSCSNRHACHFSSVHFSTT